jgi:hypothetical protein
MNDRVISGTYWINKMGEVVKITSVAKTPEETWVSYCYFGNPKNSSSLLESAFTQKFKPYNLKYDA